MTSVWLRVDRQAHAPLYAQVYRQIRQAIAEGRLGPGARLPSTRELATEFGLARNVVLIAYEQLSAEGYVEARVGAGTFVADCVPTTGTPPAAREGSSRSVEPESPAAPISEFARRLTALAPGWLREGRPDHHRQFQADIDFRYGVVEPGPRTSAEWRRCLAWAAKRSHVGYGPAAGQPELRKALAAYLAGQRGVRCAPEEIIVVNGSQQALDLTAKVLLDPGDLVAMEDPSYPGARHTFSAFGAEIGPLPVDEDGLVVSSLSSLARAPRLLYLTPSHQFPTGAVLPFPRRQQILEWADREGAWVLEDDYDSEFRYQGRPVEAVQGLDSKGRTIYVGTLSKLLFPALRLAFVVPPSQLVEAFMAAKWLADRHTPVLGQLALGRFIDTGAFERHLHRSRKLFAERRQALLAALQEHLGDEIDVSGTNAGIHLAVWFRDLSPDGVEPLMEAAQARGVRIYSIAPCYAGHPTRAGILLGYASLSPPEIARGVATIAEALAETRRRSVR